VIEFNRFELSNGLRIIHQYDPSVSTVVLNTLYNVGARDESPDRTGFAHLFEHLMFAGSKNVASFDKEIEQAGGQNNAFTNNEFTNYYISVPAENIETAFWLESDRMLALNINENSLNIQKGVVIEEFKQRCFNAPFGLLWHHVRDMLYKESPYRWPTIGLTFDHISDAKLSDVQDFYQRFYSPNNAVVSIVGNLSLNDCETLAQKWFGDIPVTAKANKNVYPKDENWSPTRRVEEDLSPNPVVFLVWKGPDIHQEDSLALELYSDVLGGSEVSELYEALVKNEGLCNAAECFYMRGLGEGLFMAYGILNEGVSQETVENRLFEIIEESFLKPDSFAFESAKNKNYTHLLFDPINPMSRAQKLAFWEHLGMPDMINNEASKIKDLELESVFQTAQKYFTRESASVLFYNPKNT
jgi:predicted Zn-dependent peptidase